MRTSEAREHYDKAKPLHTVVPIFRFIDETSYLTTSGEIAMVLRIRGREAECMLPGEVNGTARAFEQAVYRFSSEVRVYQYLCRRAGFSVPMQQAYPSRTVEFAVRERAGRLEQGYTVDACMVLVFDRYKVPVTLLQRLKHTLFSRFSERLTGDELATHMMYGHESFKRQVQTFRDELSSQVPMEILGKDEIFRFWQYLLNLETGSPVRLNGDDMVGYQAGGSDIECYRRHLMIGEQYAAILSLKTLPLRPGPNALRLLARTGAQCIVMSEYQRMPNPRAIRLIKAAQTYLLVYSNIKLVYEMFNALAGKKSEPEKPDQGKQDASDSLEELKSKLMNQNACLGNFTLAVQAYDRDLIRLQMGVDEICRSLAEIDTVMYRERLGLLRAWHAFLPGNHRFNVRSQPVTNENHADLSILFIPQTGEMTNRLLGGEYLIGFETPGGTPFFFNFMDGDCPHGMLVGSNGSGKSFLANALVVNYQKYEPWTLIFDMGGSYREITHALGGAYAQVDISDLGFRVNPFSLPESDENVLFVASFIRVLMESGTGVKLDEPEKTEVHRKVLSVYRMRFHDRNLQQFFWTLPTQGPMSRMRHLLSKWVHQGTTCDAGAYAKYFDNTEDTFNLNRFQCFDFQGMERYADVIEPLLYYVLHRALRRVHDAETASEPKLFLVDEAWRFFRNPTTRDYIIGAMKTWRKHRAAIILCTQNPEDLVSAGLELIVPEAKTVIFLHNALANEAQYKQLFKTNDEEIRLIKTMRDKRDLLIKRTNLSKLCEFIVTGAEHDLYSSTPQQIKRRIA